MRRHPQKARGSMKNQGNKNIGNEYRKSPVTDLKEMEIRNNLTKDSK